MDERLGFDTLIGENLKTFFRQHLDREASNLIERTLLKVLVERIHGFEADSERKVLLPYSHAYTSLFEFR